MSTKMRVSWSNLPPRKNPCAATVEAVVVAGKMRVSFVHQSRQHECWLMQCARAILYAYMTFMRRGRGYKGDFSLTAP